MCGSQRSTVSSLVPPHCNVLRQRLSPSLKFTESANWLEVLAQEYTCNDSHIMASFLGGVYGIHIWVLVSIQQTLDQLGHLSRPQTPFRRLVIPHNKLLSASQKLSNLFPFSTGFQNLEVSSPLGSVYVYPAVITKVSQRMVPISGDNYAPCLRSSKSTWKQALAWYFPISFCCFKGTALLKPGALFAGICYKVKEQRNEITLSLAYLIMAELPLCGCHSFCKVESWETRRVQRLPQFFKRKTQL